VLDGEDMDGVAIFRVRNLMMVTEPMVDWKSSKRRNEQGSHISARNTHCRDLVQPVNGQMGTRKGQEGMTHGDLVLREPFFRLR
jgi:hypothetical protein